MPTHTEDCQCAICKAGIRNGDFGQHGPYCPCARPGCGNGK
jgi:hypothetical protein